MIEIIVALALSFGGGYWYGHETPTVSCLNADQVVQSCIDIQPPKDLTFGETTDALMSAVKQYRKCQSACQAAK